MSDLSFTLWIRIDSHPKRLDAYLAKCLEESRTLIKTLFEEHRVLVNNHLIKSKVSPEHTCVITLKNFRLPSERILSPNPDLNLPLLFEDDDILVIDKPRGICVNALSYKNTKTVANFLITHTPGIQKWDPRKLEPGIVHRLDQWTSGCLVCVKTLLSYQNLQKQFQNRRVTKKYLALVEGQLTCAEEWQDDLIHDPKNIRKMCVLKPFHSATLAAKKRHARLSYKPLQVFDDFTLVQIRLYTGRMHQIRVQFSHQGYPIAGDKLYGAKTPTSFCHQWLHAKELSFFHPKTHKKVSFKSLVPSELDLFLKTLKTN